MKLKEKKYTACALISCNVSYKNEITEKKLLDILLGKEIPGKWIGHIDCFFNEIPKKILLGFMSENKISYSDLKSTYYSLPKVVQGKNFLEISNAQ